MNSFFKILCPFLILDRNMQISSLRTAHDSPCNLTYVWCFLMPPAFWIIFVFLLWIMALFHLVKTFMRLVKSRQELQECELSAEGGPVLRSHIPAPPSCLGQCCLCGLERGAKRNCSLRSPLLQSIFTPKQMIPLKGKKFQFTFERVRKLNQNFLSPSNCNWPRASTRALFGVWKCFSTSVAAPVGSKPSCPP